MFKGLSQFAKSKNGMWVFVAIIILFVIWALMTYSKSKGVVSDNMYSAESAKPYSSGFSEQASPSAVSNVPSAVAAQPGSYALQPVANPGDLLPQDKNSQWASLNPVNNGTPMVVDLMAAGTFIGLDTIGQTLRNANLQLRSDPIIEKKEVGPWLRSTIEPDLGRVPLELGCGGR